MVIDAKDKIASELAAGASAVLVTRRTWGGVLKGREGTRPVQAPYTQSPGLCPRIPTAPALHGEVFWDTCLWSPLRGRWKRDHV